jgi:hypothetical protein
MFNEGKINVHDQSGHPSLNAEDLKNRIDKHIRPNRSFTLDEMHEIFPQISHSRNCCRTSPLQKNLCQMDATDTC